MTETEPFGHIKQLPGGRLVFLGQRAGCPDYDLVVRSEEGEDTYMRISSEALAAVVELYGLPAPYLSTFPHQERKMWRSA